MSDISHTGYPAVVVHTAKCGRVSRPAHNSTAEAARADFAPNGGAGYRLPKTCTPSAMLPQSSPRKALTTAPIPTIVALPTTSVPEAKIRNAHQCKWLIRGYPEISAA